MAREGMDVDQIEADGNQLKNLGGNTIPQVISAVDSIVAQLHNTWHGDDAQAFVNHWQSTGKPQLTTIAHNVATQGETALTNVSQQRAASAGNAI